MTTKEKNGKKIEKMNERGRIFKKKRKKDEKKTKQTRLKKEYGTDIKRKLLTNQNIWRKNEQKKKEEKNEITKEKTTRKRKRKNIPWKIICNMTQTYSLPLTFSFSTSLSLPLSPSSFLSIYLYLNLLYSLSLSLCECVVLNWFPRSPDVTHGHFLWGATHKLRLMGGYVKEIHGSLSIPYMRAPQVRRHKLSLTKQVLPGGTALLWQDKYHPPVVRLCVCV